MLSGGDGADRFRYATYRHGGDTILDVTPGEDVIEIQAGRFGGGLVAGMDLAGTGRFVANATGTATITEAQLVLDTTTAALFFDTNGTARGGLHLIAVLNTTALSAQDFVILA